MTMNNTQKIEHSPQGMWFIRQCDDRMWEVYQKTGAIVARTGREENAREVAASLNKCAVVPQMKNHRLFMEDENLLEKIAHQIRLAMQQDHKVHGSIDRAAVAHARAWYILYAVDFGFTYQHSEIDQEMIDKYRQKVMA